MSYNSRDCWRDTLDFIITNPVVLAPFVLVAFLEGLALEFIYFSSRKPLSFLIDPIVKKFMGEQFTHYPGNIIAIPQLFYYLQIFIYIVFAVFLAAIAVHIFKHAHAKLPLKLNTIMKNAQKRYLSFLLYGILMATLLFLSRNLALFAYDKISSLLAASAPNFVERVETMSITLLMFLANVVTMTFMVSAIPLIVFKNKPFGKALLGSFVIGFRNFPTLFFTILIPFLLYLPLGIVNAHLAELAKATFPEIIIYVVALGFIVAIFVDCIVVIAASHFVIKKYKEK